MSSFELDKWALKTLYDLYKRKRLDVQPEYQRSKAWTDRYKQELVDTVRNQWPMGLIMLNVDPRVDSDGNAVEYHEVVDGQQRLRSLFEYKDGSEPWAQLPPGKPIGFTPYGELTEASQERFDDYRVSVAPNEGLRDGRNSGHFQPVAKWQTAPNRGEGQSPPNSAQRIPKRNCRPSLVLRCGFCP